jgi:hypothetical protein
MRHDTGSHIDVDGCHLLAGLAVGGELANAHATFGAFFEYGTMTPITASPPPRESKARATPT